MGCARSQFNSEYPDNMKKTPIIVVILAWIMLIGGIFTLLITLPLLTMGDLGKSGLFLSLGAITLIKGVLLVVISFGLRYLKKWSLYTYTGLTVLGFCSAIYFYFSSPGGRPEDFIDIGINVLVLAYLWSISKKFS